MIAPAGQTALIRATTKLWHKYHLTYDQARYVIKEVRKTFGVKRIKVRKRAIQRLSRDGEQRLIQRVYRDTGERGLLIKQIQKFLGHAKLETTQVYAEATPEMLKDSYRRALAE